MNITITVTAEKYIQETLNNYHSDPKLVGISLYRDKDKQDHVEFIHHFVGNQHYVTGTNLDIGICLFPHAVTEFKGTVIDYDGEEFFTRKNV